MKEEWTIRRALPTDDEAAAHFLASLPEFSGTLREGDQGQVWRWLYIDADKQARIVFVAENAEGAMIAHYGLAKLPYVVAGRRVDAGMACLLAIDNRYRKTSIFLDMTVRLLKASKSDGWAFVTGLANRAGLLSFHKAFGFTEIGDVPVLAKPIKIGKIAKSVLPWSIYAILSPFAVVTEAVWLSLLRYMSEPKSKKINMKQITRFDHALTEIAEQHVAKYHKHFAERGQARIQNGRFFGIACRQYEAFQITENEQPQGYFAIRIMDMKGFKALAVVDVCFDFARQDIAREFCRAIDRLALEKKVDLISILVNSKPLTTILRRNFFLRTQEKFQLVIYLPGSKRGLTESCIDDWFITWFEHDFV